jgi:hypothetical protein
VDLTHEKRIISGCCVDRHPLKGSCIARGARSHEATGRPNDDEFCWWKAV